MAVDHRTAWIRYLDAVEESARMVCTRLQEGQIPNWPSFVQPAAPCPEELESRRLQVLAALETATTVARGRRDTIAGDLARMHPPRAAAPSGSLGGRFDVLS